MQQGHIVFFKSIEKLLSETRQENITQAVMFHLRHTKQELNDGQNH